MDGEMDRAAGELVDILKRRQIDTICYLHTDHFEPWSLGLNEKTARGVERFGDMARGSPFARKHSLFYCAYLPYFLDSARADAVVFGRRSAEQERLARAVIEPLVTSDRHEMHLHIHHEFWTRNDSNFDTVVSRWVNANSTEEMDKARLDEAFIRFKEVIAAETGRSFDRWAFIHGNWALAASDPTICKIDNELGMIMRHGGFGDFSFPAGRGHCDPKLQAPFTCLPLDVKRAYDDPAADPRLIEAGSGTLRPDRFFIWNSPIKARHSSLDYYSEPNRNLFEEPDRLIGEWFKGSVSFGSTLFIKTHAHSMKWEYKIDEPGSLIPHCYPPVIRVFERLMRICDRAGVDFQPVTVNEVMDRLHDFDRDPAAPRPQKMNSAPIAIDTVGILEDEIATLLRRWVHADPERMASAGEFYLALLSGDHVLQDYERAVLDHVIDKLPADRMRIVEVGVGYGILSLMLAAKGYDVIAFEGDALRLAGLRFLIDSLADRIPGLRDRLKPVAGWFPDAFDKAMLGDDRRTLLLTTNVVASATADRQDAVLAAARDFDDLIIDTTRFGVRRYAPEAAAHFQAKVAAGYPAKSTVWRSEPNEIWHFQTTMEDDTKASDPHAEGLSLPKDPGSFNTEVLSLYRDWLAGQDPGSDDLYASKLSRGTSLEAYEVAIAAAITERFESNTTIVEIGSGYGALALQLAQDGFVVQGFEGDRRRSAACVWHLEKYLARYPQLAGRVSCVSGFFPDVMPPQHDGSSGKRVGLATNVTCTFTATHRDAIFEAMKGFDELIIDLSRFGKARNTQEERDALRAIMAASHFEPVEKLHFADPYEYWRFRVRQPVALEAPIAVPAQRAPDPVFPLRGESGVLYSVYGDQQLDACPVCHGRNTVGLWRMPMASLKEPISLFGGYFNQVPTLQVPATVYCFDFCRECESVFLNPTPKSQKDQYRKSEHYLRMMQDASQWQGYENAYDRFANWIPDSATTLMDAACGIGQYLEVARKRAPDRWKRLIGLELSEKYVEHMLTQGIEAHAFDIDNEDLGQFVAPESVDFITFCEAFEHVERPLDALEKLVRTLRPGGRLYFTAQRYGKDVQAAVRPGEPIYIGEKVIRDLPRRLGCKVIDVSTSSMRYYVILEK